ncbi:CinA family protein [Nocardia africana]|uniref:Competence damage-inducible protein A n=1 Tax=Nocardia africana TaxID=134964 RepID=A0A378X0C8_9NOCA|nr:nicotinamide-nucleotide amidohydrolase family protein [Nocardia africana]MCC3312653.1 CinA family protein [Nocardia africana]SUA46023.1 competence damage-inducible protein A [Nocardia africana]
MTEGPAERIAELATAAGSTIAVAESLTSGKIASALGAAPDAGQWFRGGVVAYSPEVKRTVLDMPDVPVVSRPAAEALAATVRKLLGASYSVAVTGVGGPEPSDGEPPGTVWFATASETAVTACRAEFDGAPEEVLEQTVQFALSCLLDRLTADR